MDTVRQVLHTTVREHSFSCCTTNITTNFLCYSSKDDTQGKSPLCTRCSNRYYPRRHPLAACVPSCVRTLLESDPLPPWFKCLGRWDFRERLPNKQTPLWGFDLDQKPTTSASAESAAPSTARYFGLGGNYRAQSQVSSSLDQQMELPIDLIG